ncbi:tRNA (adenosine(37)-N6)-threonylcarbamoyltransferase complex dimerization subunit type 1 TsaB [Caloranaerobacter azorensis]|uniref:tRNA (Adenosine(37)-N6)-threonylcarbamoyltransferase complex dimerization subunit type 1 TsaB n=1 Tax=Caloranaerobacter azorensis TaxID=116090 RepID=A0A6P1YDR8_9FIRM|nr:tRNA (adenosine(37)-N6)-threonylcarbamoyltransferase complex dimerization subunit type 1 TsaB [Caloranaerobacter azorensis]QIB27470.1 tRNA (adenosine(37)-N6)-threonylcarbamoyltransferase complex dimerization subunit type 1 TsaB [Caloranaerobacter azorensis]
MKVLAVDTSSIVATCAILDEDRLISEYILNNKRTHSQKIMPIIKEILESSELKPEDIDVFAVSIGPGSFTGLRIGVATIKSLAHALGKSVIGIPTLDALAFNLPYSEGIIVPMMDARRDRVFTGIYKWENGSLCVIQKPDVMELDELMNILKERDESIIVNGDGTLVYRQKIIEALGDRVFFAPKSANMARASSVAELALSRAKEGKFENFFDLVPDYLRKSQAQREYEEKIKCCGEKNE